MKTTRKRVREDAKPIRSIVHSSNERSIETMDRDFAKNRSVHVEEEFLLIEPNVPTTLNEVDELVQWNISDKNFRLLPWMNEDFSTFESSFYLNQRNSDGIHRWRSMMNFSNEIFFSVDEEKSKRTRLMERIDLEEK